MLFSPFDDTDQCRISSRPSSPATRANDISRILDPSYASPSSSSSHSPTAYVDTHGDWHDPDYRDFPTLLPHHTKRPRSATPCHSLAAAYHSARPAWERSEFLDEPFSDRDDADADHDDEADNDYCCEPRPHASNRSSFHSSISPRHQHHHNNDLYHKYHPRDNRQTFAAYARSSPEPSPPMSFDSSLPDDSDHFYHDDREKLRKQPRFKSVQKNPFSEKSSQGLLFDIDALPEVDEVQAEVDDDELGDADDDRAGDSEWTPTCTQAMRRQWQAISLRFRFGVFRAKREVRRRVTGR